MLMLAQRSSVCMRRIDRGTGESGQGYTYYILKQTKVDFNNTVLTWHTSTVLPPHFLGNAVLPHFHESKHNFPPRWITSLPLHPRVHHPPLPSLDCISTSWNFLLNHVKLTFPQGPGGSPDCATWKTSARSSTSWETVTSEGAVNWRGRVYKSRLLGTTEFKPTVRQK